MWLWVLSLLLLANLKVMPFAWHFRFFRSIWAGALAHKKVKHLLRPKHVFHPAVSTTKSPLMEGDFNLHKSNSTYFTDLDVSRGFLSGILFGPILWAGIDGRLCNLIVGAVACSFRKEVKLYQSYETWTRLASWDEKWIYMVTHFVKTSPGASSPTKLQSEAEKSADKDDLALRKGVENGSTKRTVVATAVTQFVSKQGRKTVSPEQMLIESGWFVHCNSNEHNAQAHGNNEAPTSASNGELEDQEENSPRKSIPEDIDLIRKKNLPVVRLEMGWDKVHELFNDDAILGCHTGFFK